MKTLIIILSLVFVSPVLAESKLHWTMDGQGNATPYKVSRQPDGSTRVFNLNTGEVGINCPTNRGSVSIQTGNWPDPNMQMFLTPQNDGDEGEE